MTDQQTEHKSHAYQMFLAAHARLIAKIDEDMKRSGGLDLDVFEVLNALGAEPGDKLRLSDLAQRVRLSRSGLTRRLDRLEKLGYITRDECRDDRRGAFATLTEKGRQAKIDGSESFEVSIKRNFGDRMTEGESRQLAALMKRIIDHLERKSD